MAPFHFQTEALTHHAVWGLEALKTGVFTPPPLVGATPFADLQDMVGGAVTALEALTPMKSIAGPARIWTLSSFDRSTGKMPRLRNGSRGHWP
jgi:hypothetical protein